FVHLLLDKETPLEELLADPIARARAQKGAHNPHIPLPRAIYPSWKNSAGVDLGYLTAHTQLLSAMQSAAPLKLAPAAASVDTAIATTRAGFSAWANAGADARATLLERGADALEANLPALLSLL